jgi:ElaB/YqjD/DUF883 family membrane-anchored ribosome-binding protein
MSHLTRNPIMDTPTTAPSTPVADDRVAQHLRTLADEADALLKATARAGDERYEASRERLRAEVAHLRSRLTELESAAEVHLKNAAHRSNEAVHAHPYAAMGVAAAAGLLLGTLLARR